MKWFVVIGREDNEEAEACVFQCADNAAAVALYKAHVVENREAAEKDDEIYTYHVIDCGDRQPTVEAPIEY